VTGLADWFVEHRLDDGGWNCEWVEGSTRSSFHSTLNSLKGILFYQEATSGGFEQLEVARHAGEEYLLERRLTSRLTTGEQVDDWVTRFTYPLRWLYSVLNAADYFRAASLHDEVAPDPRLADAIEIIRAARQPDGTWIQEHKLPGAVWFDIDVKEGEASPWLTFYATRVLDWWDSFHAG
jgi:hypothetical protein